MSQKFESRCPFKRCKCHFVKDAQNVSRCECLDSTEVLYSRVVRIDASVLSVQSYYIPGLSVSLRVS